MIFTYIYRLKQAKDLRETLVEKLKIATESTLSAEERAARMDELLEDEDKRQKEIDYQLKYLRDMQFKKMQELHDNRTEERNTEAEIQVGDSFHFGKVTIVDLVNIWATTWQNMSSGVSDLARHKPACAATETRESLEISAIESRDIILS